MGVLISSIWLLVMHLGRRFFAVIGSGSGKLSTCFTERTKSERKAREVATMAGLVGDEANYDDSKKVWSLVYNTCQKV